MKKIVKQGLVMSLYEICLAGCMAVASPPPSDFVEPTLLNNYQANVPRQDTAIMKTCAAEECKQPSDNAMKRFLKEVAKELEIARNERDAAIQQKDMFEQELYKRGQELQTCKGDLHNKEQELQTCKKKCSRVPPEPHYHFLPPPPITTPDINCKGEKLQFVKVTPEQSLIEIDLTAEKAGNIYRQAQQMSNSSIYPYVFRAVSDAEGKRLPMSRHVKPFWIQTSPVSQTLYSKVMGNVYLIDRVSYNDATKFLKELPKYCGLPNYQFNLPTEEQFVYLSRRIYKDNNRLQKCNALTKLKTPEGIEKLLGNKWQLTTSSCISWSNDDSNPSGQCTGNGKSYVKKGGTTHSKDASECVPEYRAESTPDVREPDTTLRLIWVAP